MKHNNPVSIFIIDEDELVAMALKNEIEKAFAHHTVSVLTFSGENECEPFLDQRPDVVILSDQPGEKGDNLITKIKKRIPRGQLILLVKEETAEIAVKALHLGIHDYIVKNEHMFKKLRLSLLQCFTILELRRNMKRQVSLGILSIIIVFLMFGVALGLRAYVPASLMIR